VDGSSGKRKQLERGGRTYWQKYASEPLRPGTLKVGTSQNAGRSFPLNIAPTCVLEVMKI
jgi:hypothetical protein